MMPLTLQVSQELDEWEEEEAEMGGIQEEHQLIMQKMMKSRLVS